MSRASTSWIVAAPALLFSSVWPTTRAEKVQLTIATLHAAALTTSRAVGDSTDAPFFVVSVIGPHASSASILRDSSSRVIRQDEALGARPLTELSLAAGDSVEVLVSVLENSRVQSADEAAVAAMPTKTRSTSSSERVDQATRLVAPLVKQGANYMGSASLLVTNEGGTIFWRRLECVASCKVLSAPAATALSANTAQPAAGVVELSGNGGTYHLALRANRAQ